MLPKAIGAVILGLAWIIPASSEADPASDLHALIEKGPAGDSVEEILTFSSKAAENLVAYASHMAGLPEEVSTSAKLTGEVVGAIEKVLGSKFRSLVGSTEMVEALQTSWKALLSAEDSVSSGDLIDFTKGAQEEINRLPLSKGMESVAASILILKELYYTTRNLFQKVREQNEQSQKNQAVRRLHQRQLQAEPEPDTIPICESPVQGNTNEESFDYSDRFPSDCLFVGNPSGILYSLQVTENTDVTLSTCNGNNGNTNYDTAITVYKSDDTCFTANNDAFNCNGASELTFPAVAGTTYLVLVHGFDGTVNDAPAGGDFELTVTPASGEILPPVACASTSESPATTGEDATITTGEDATITTGEDATITTGEDATITTGEPPATTGEDATTGGPPATKQWCQHVGYLDYATRGKGFQKATKACLKLAVMGADEIPEKAGAQNASPKPLPFTWLLMPGAVLSITASMVLVKRFRALSSWTAMPMAEPEDEESEALDVSRNEM